jgi:uncharacterized phage-associated protein
MIKHCIILASAYKLGKRIALHYSDSDILQMDVISNDINYILDKCGRDAPISIHYIHTKGKNFDSVEKKDAFFSGVKEIDTKEKFAKILLDDRVLEGVDVARYILTKVPCTHLKIEKLVYMCYADYLCNENKKLFEDNIYAYRYGPVIESIYKKYKHTNNLEDDGNEPNKEYYKEENFMPFRSRIISSFDGVKKLISINNTIEKYASLSAEDLVELTHKRNSPWEHSGKGEYINRKITDDIIKKYHINEVL